jgi:signal peptidase I
LASSTAADRRARRAARRKADRPDGPNGAAPPRKKGPIREWFETVAIALAVMIVVRTLLVDQFRIPSESMEQSLLVGDFLFVSKLHYGTRTPMSVGVPFTRIHVPGLDLPGTRMPGFTEPKRGDALVFNWPADRGVPIDRKTHYIKRIVATPGDTLAIENGTVLIDGDPLPEVQGSQFQYFAIKKDPRTRVSPARLEELGVAQVMPQIDPSFVAFNASPEAAERVGALAYVDRVERVRARRPGEEGFSDRAFPIGAEWTVHDFGPIVPPGEGETVTFTPENSRYLVPTIAWYEGVDAQRLPDGSVTIDGAPALQYTFGQDYFFVMGDNRDNSEDSRIWGFVPMDHVVGKAVLIYFSFNSGGFPVRFGRMLRPVPGLD